LQRAAAMLVGLQRWQPRPEWINEISASHH
jgi:hypothetical protein